MENKRILVIGGTGYIGREIVKELYEQGYDVFVLSRNYAHRYILPNNINFIIGDLLDRDFLLKIIKSFDLVIYLASIIRAFNKKKYKENIIGLQNTLDAMEKNGIKRIIYFSTQNIYLKNKGYYSRSKEECEKFLKSRILDYVIIRPNYVYGIDRTSDFYKIYKFIQYFHFFPLIGRGEVRFQPINKKDIVKLTIRSISFKESYKEINASGPDILSIKKLLYLIAHNAQLKYKIINIPFLFLKIFKNFAPFDIESYNEDRIFKDAGSIFIGDSSVIDDINKIILL